MAFVTIDPATIEVGDALKAELFHLVKANLDDHETRINQVESLSSKVDIFKFLLMNASSFSTATGIAYYRCEQSFTITKAAIQIFEKGSLAGFIEFDIKKSITNMDGASFSSIFTTKPKIDLAVDANYHESSNQVLDGASINMLAGQYLRLDITIAPTNGPVPKMFITSYGE